ncbi:MAG: YraN family protein [Terrimesophilobacter sp.]
MAAKDELGRRGEELAAIYLSTLGHVVLERNWRCSLGEVDLITRDGADTVFVEVKTRSSLAFGHPFEAITDRKLARLRKLAGEWCAQQTSRHGPIRIDAVSVIASSGQTPDIEHLRRVF